MFEILTKEQVAEMSDRELNLSRDYYNNNLELIVKEQLRRVSIKEENYLNKDSCVPLVDCETLKADYLSFEEQKNKSKTRGRKKRDK